MKLIRTLSDGDLLPTIVFSFSRRECESNAASLSDFDFTTPEEKQCIRVIFTNSTFGLSDEDKNLTQVCFFYLVVPSVKACFSSDCLNHIFIYIRIGCLNFAIFGTWHWYSSLWLVAIIERSH